MRARGVRCRTWWLWVSAATARSRSFNSTGTAHCLVDVFGYFSASTGDRFNPVSPARLYDTREGNGIRAGKVPDGTPIEVQVAGRAGVPSSAHRRSS